ncbi:repeat protein [Seminavis robusta]|uniref:Repeat protein n=1 Tax=Seminavis robusta TaxID=568900 RepID=A0A9N8I128_9STRA|nr:repeat protein [Seminavis robusta]|eukprot:Sro3067_g343120.1 repeat protein (622) ;mRNA; f:5098-6963
MDAQETTPLAATGAAKSAKVEESDWIKGLCVGGHRTRSFWVALVLLVLVLAITGTTTLLGVLPWKVFGLVKDVDWLPNVIVENYSLPISFQQEGSSPRDAATIQHLFDVGLMECYGFAFPEAQSTARKALKYAKDPTACPMCHWLLAMAHAPYINHPTLSKTDYQNAQNAANDAVQAMLDTQLSLTRKEQGLIQAIATRFTSQQNQTVGYQLYRREVERLFQQFPNDPDIMAFLADAIMVLHANATGYYFYEPNDDNGTPIPDISYAMHVLLERCLAAHHHHPLCQHLYIHVTEPSDHVAQKAETTADQLAAATAFTQAQHLQHMPSHTYWRIGRYHDAVQSNIHAHESDQAYIHHQHWPYGPAHDTAFLIDAAIMSGERHVAYDYAEKLRAHYQQFPDAPDYPDAQLGWHSWSTTRLRWGDAKAVLEEHDPLPRDDWPYAQILGHYSKGVAYLMTTTKDTQRARQHLHELQTILDNYPQSDYFRQAMLATWTLSSALEYHQKQHDPEQALTLIQMARQEQEQWAYTEPPAWHMPIAQCEADLLFRMERAQDAARVFQQDLERIPENRFSLWGWYLAAAQQQHDDTKQLDELKRRFDQASQWADDTVKDPIVCPLYYYDGL